MNLSFAKSGDNLEFRAAAYFQAHGYLVRRGVLLSVAAGTADATDIDLLAIRFTVPLAEQRLIADCKDRRKPRPFERILWTKGLASFAGATQAVVVVPKAVWQAREFAAQEAVEVLDVLEIERFLRSLNSSYLPFGDADSRLAHQRRQHNEKDAHRHESELRQMLVRGHPLTNLNRIIKILSGLGKTINDSAQTSWLRRCICFDAAVIASVMLVRFAAESKWTPEKDWTGYARKKLTFGDVSPQKALQLAELALDRRISEGIPSPAYTGEIIEVIRALIANPNIAAHLPMALDFYLFGRGPMGRGNPLNVNGVGEKGAEDALRMSRRVLSALSYAAGIPSVLWQSELHQKEVPHSAMVLSSEGAAMGGRPICADQADMPNGSTSGQPSASKDLAIPVSGPDEPEPRLTDHVVDLSAE